MYDLYKLFVQRVLKSQAPFPPSNLQTPLHPQRRRRSGWGMDGSPNRV